MRESAAAGVGGAEVLGATFADRWTALRQPGHGFVISYFFSAADLTGPNLDAVGFYDADHTALVVALRRNTTGLSVSALVRYTTIQPTPPAQTASSTGSRGASGIRCWTRCQVHGG